METSLILGAAGVLLGAVVQGTTGFGIAFIAAPALLLLMPPTLVMPVMVVLSIVNNLVVLIGSPRALKARLILPMVAGGVLGLPLGAWLLRSADPRWFKLGLGVFVMIAAVVLLTGFRRHMPHQKTGLSVAGFLGGVLHTSTSISGPPLILFLSNQGIDKDSFRTALQSYFVVMNLVSIAIFAWMGLMGREVWLAGAVYLVPLLLGSLIGVWLSRRVDESLFRKIVLAVVLALAVSLIATSLAPPA